MFSIHAKVSLSRLWFLGLHHQLGSDIRKVTRLRPDEMKLTSTEAGQSSGFRARYLIGAIESLERAYPGAPDPLEEATRASSTRVRMTLVNLDYIGPKVADCFMLNAVGDVSAPPIDVNVYRAAQSLGILPAYIGLPSAELCARCACTPRQAKEEGIPLCPKAERTMDLLEGKTNSVSGTCARAGLSIKFEDAGWNQSLLFLYGQQYCTNYYPSCDSCQLKDYSVRKQIAGLVPVRTRLEVTPRTGFVRAVHCREYPCL